MTNGARSWRSCTSSSPHRWPSSYPRPHLIDEEIERVLADEPGLLERLREVDQRRAGSLGLT